MHPFVRPHFFTFVRPHLPVGSAVYNDLTLFHPTWQTLKFAPANCWTKNETRQQETLVLVRPCLRACIFCTKRPSGAHSKDERVIRPDCSRCSSRWHLTTWCMTTVGSLQCSMWKRATSLSSGRNRLRSPLSKFLKPPTSFLAVRTKVCTNLRTFLSKNTWPQRTSKSRASGTAKRRHCFQKMRLGTFSDERTWPILWPCVLKAFRCFQRSCTCWMQTSKVWTSSVSCCESATCTKSRTLKSSLTPTRRHFTWWIYFLRWAFAALIFKSLI